MHTPKTATAVVIAIACLFATPRFVVPALGGQVVKLDKDNWHLVPGGKEVDAIYGDYLMHNDKVVVVIASVIINRQLNLRISQAQGCVVDFATLVSKNDQLTTYHPQGFTVSTAADADGRPPPAADRLEVVKAEGPEEVVRVSRKATGADPVEVVTDYTLKDGNQYLTVATRRRNTGDKPAKVRLTDRLFHEKPATIVPPGQHELVCSFDRYFGMAYGLVRADGQELSVPPTSPTTVWTSAGLIDYRDLITSGAGPGGAEIPPGKDITLTRLLLVGEDAAEVQRLAMAALKVQGSVGITAAVTDDQKKPVAGASVTAYPAEVWDKAATPAARKALAAASFGFTKADGQVALPVRDGDYMLMVEQPGRVSEERRVSVKKQDAPVAVVVPVGPVSRVAFEVTDGEGQPSPAKVQFVGVGATPTPDLGPDQRADGCRNLWFSVKGQFEVPLPPGDYYVLVSRGPEYNAVWRTIKLTAGKTVKLPVRLPRVVDTAGWISTDFHNHSSPSGDNSTQVEGRLAALIAEGVEFAPATEHQRLMSYRPYLKAMGAEQYMGTSDGIELTGLPLPLNHHNAFPLHAHPHTQFGGGPEVHKDPITQIKRLRDHDGGAEKLVQQNHPDIGWLIYDKDGDGKPDSGHGTLPYTDVIEIWRTSILNMSPAMVRAGNRTNDRSFNWLQLLNQGHRIPGVANTDAHACFHESGIIRNWVRSATDDPAAVKEMDIVRTSKKGQLIMSSGPFLEVSLSPAAEAAPAAGPGDDLKLTGEGRLKVRVQCPNWLDVDRVQVLVNGRPEPAMNFTRAANPKLFTDGIVKFEQTIPLKLAADAHVIVVAIGEQSTAGPVMGVAADVPLAISNPIYVDTDGGGFKANGDTLGAPPPTKLDR